MKGLFTSEILPLMGVHVLVGSGTLALRAKGHRCTTAEVLEESDTEGKVEGGQDGRV